MQATFQKVLSGWTSTNILWTGIRPAQQLLEQTRRVGTMVSPAFFLRNAPAIRNLDEINDLWHLNTVKRVKMNSGKY